MNEKNLIINIRHPNYWNDMNYWTEWRLAYDSGDRYTMQYLRQFTKRETAEDFNLRRSITPVPAFAKAAINDIRNSIFQRMRDVLRKNGSKEYLKAVEGEGGGVDNRGSNMTAFMGYTALTELLVMGKVGVYVDMPVFTGETLAQAQGARPYLYMYAVEDILSWTSSLPDTDSDYQAVLLRDQCVDYNSVGDMGFQTPIELPSGSYERYRLVYINPAIGLVNVQFYNSDGNPTDSKNRLTDGPQPTELQLTRIPFVLLDIGDSLLKDVCKHQIALLNLGSSDVAYALKANFPFYTEQRDLKAFGSHLKHDGMSGSNDSGAAGGDSGVTEIKVGATQGIAYGMGADRPEFINPSAEPLTASMKLQEKLEDDIRKLVNLAVANKTGKAISSAESKDMDNQGLEAGLSFIGLVLENSERKIAGHWASYEEKNPSRRQIPVIKYPDRYSLKSDASRIDEATKLSKLMYSVPGQTVKRELAKCIVTSLFTGKVSVDTLETIDNEIENASYTTSEPDVILKALEAGSVGDKTASMALGFDEQEYLKARDDHLARIMRIAQAQQKGAGAGAEAQQDANGQPLDNPAARGVKDLAADPNAAAQEKKVAQDAALEPDHTKPVRGKGQ
jgi:hypothetical protein